MARKEFYFEEDRNHNRKIIISDASEIGYFYYGGTVEAYDETVLAESVKHPMKACRLLKEYWITTKEKRIEQEQQKIEASDKIWLEQPLVKIMAGDYKTKYNNFNIIAFKQWYRRNIDDYEEMYPDLGLPL